MNSKLSTHSLDVVNMVSRVMLEQYVGCCNYAGEFKRRSEEIY